MEVTSKSSQQPQVFKKLLPKSNVEDLKAQKIHLTLKVMIKTIENRRKAQAMSKRQSQKSPVPNVNPKVPKEPLPEVKKWKKAKKCQWMSR